MIPSMYLFLLQDYWKPDNPLEGYILLIAIGAIVVFSIILFIIRRVTSRSSLVNKGNSDTHTTPIKFNTFKFHRLASSYGLDREQTKLLEAVFKNSGVTDPQRIINDPTALDRHFKRAYKTIEGNFTSDEDTQERLANLFSLRNTIGTFTTTSDATPANLTENTPAILACGRESYPVKVISSKSQSIITETPRNALGSPIRFVKGIEVTLSFFTKSNSGFSFNGKINGVVNTDRGQGLQIAYTGKMKPLVKRSYSRKQINERCEISPVRVEVIGKGRKKTSKLIVENRKYNGIVQDISVGGCSMKSAAPLQPGSRLKIAIESEENYQITILGQVLRINRSGRGIIFHIKFLKVPRRAFNSISAIVFGYNDD